MINTYSILHQVKSNTGDILIITPDKSSLDKLQREVEFFLPEYSAISLPPWDCMPHENTSPSPLNTTSRFIALYKICIGGENKPHNQTNVRNKSKIVITTPYGLSQRLPPKHIIEKSHLMLKIKQTTRENIIDFLSLTGYYATNTVSDAGEFSNRSSVIDIMSGVDAFRLRFDGGILESIKTLDINSQHSTSDINDVLIYSCSDIIGDYERKQGIERGMCEIYGTSSTVMDYLSDATIYTLEYNAIKNEFIYNKLKEQPSNLYMQKQELDELLDNGCRNSLLAMNLNPTGVVPNFYKKAEKFGSSFSLISTSKELKDNIIVACYGTIGTRSRIAKAFEAHSLSTIAISNINEVKKHNRTILLAQLPLTKGFSLLKHNQLTTISHKRNLDENLNTHPEVVLKPNIESPMQTESILFLSEVELLGLVHTQKRTSKKQEVNLLSFVIGDAIVHEQHGVGIFNGLQNIPINGKNRDFISITYTGGDKLLVPVENINLISRYGHDKPTHLDKLGGSVWQNRKERLRKKIYEISNTIVQVTAQRKAIKIEPTEINASEFDKFCMTFPYIETTDQENAIADICEDLRSGIVMDRLICGEAGFGKTEVAVRAAYLVASNGGQVAVLTPSTILCAQHLETFHGRLSPFGLKVEQLSRFNSNKSKTKSDISEGKINIIIGTHALLSNIKFKNIKLLIIDEEQLFGVKQKEKIKSMYSSIHVLSMSATPIPRTLHMALIGLRDLSIIATPPIDKADTETVVSEYDEKVIINAIAREIHRKGQVFYVCPKINQLNSAIEKLSILFPKLSIVKAHGGMPNEDLERAMKSFYDGNIDILVSTTIVESGLNIPNANTIIIEHAQHLGVSQLYQLRGRVGRHKTRGHAYILLPQSLTQVEKTLNRISILRQVNSGLAIASHDMDERGFGNLLGKEQSGDIREIGIELYQKMLEEAINNISSEVKQSFDPEVNLGLPVSIPETYVTDNNTRLLLYRRAANIKDEPSIENFATELEDRFGSMPITTINLLTILKYKLLCRKSQIAKINYTHPISTIAFFNNLFTNFDKLIELINKSKNKLKITPKQELQLVGDLNDLNLLLYSLVDICKMT